MKESEYLRALGGKGVSGLYEVMSWVAYGITAVVMLTVSVSAILAGLALRFVAESLRGLGDGRGEGDTRTGKN